VGSLFAGYRAGYISPEVLSGLQDIFELVWQEINAVGSDGDGRDASALRRDLAEVIMAHCHMDDPTLIRETVVREIRNSGARRWHRL
jgi:hypothetical protein